MNEWIIKKHAICRFSLHSARHSIVCYQFGMPQVGRSEQQPSTSSSSVSVSLQTFLSQLSSLKNLCRLLSFSHSACPAAMQHDLIKCSNIFSGADAISAEERWDLIKEYKPHDSWWMQKKRKEIELNDWHWLKVHNMFLWSSSQTDCLYFLWLSIQSKQMAGLQSSCLTRGFFQLVGSSCPLSLHAHSGGVTWFSLWFGKALWVSFSCDLASYELKLIDSWIDYNGIHEVWRPAQGAALCKHTIGGSKQKDNRKAAANVIFCWVLLCKHVQKKWEGFFWCNANGT